MAQKGWLIQLDKCIGCESCAIACKAENNTEPLQSSMLTKDGIPRHTTWRWVIMKESGTYPDVKKRFVTSACNHCQHPACQASCPADAISKRVSDGIVLIDQDKCIGCRYCEWACPYGVPQYNANTKKVEKCTFCVHRIDAGLNPACESTCVGGAIHSEDFDTSKSGENKPDGFPTPSYTVPSTRFEADTLP
jgi:Fe-S-cluster-containing dehydrogenase component